MNNKTILFLVALTCSSLAVALAIPTASLTSGFLQMFIIHSKVALIARCSYLWHPSEQWILYVGAVIGIIHWTVGYRIYKRSTAPFKQLNTYITISIITVGVYIFLSVGYDFLMMCWMTSLQSLK